MSFYHINQHEALNQNLTELDGQIKFLLIFFPPHTQRDGKEIHSASNHTSSSKYLKT